MVAGTRTARVEWREPRTDLPIMRYKVFWSRRVRGIAGELDSVLVNHQIVPKEQTSYEITNLQPNSTYFIQVQTISQYGTSKLRSEKAAVLYNTTATKEQKAPEALRRRGSRVIKSLKLENVIWNNHDIRARVHWIPIAKSDTTKRYLVRWKYEQCNNKQQSSEELSAITEQTTFDIYELKYGCVYRVAVDRPSSEARSDPDAELLVAVPKCEYFQKKVEHLKC
ncbi:Anosmin-1 [Eumeta japonica]|uniref:Anosmin-1 n=1 Tax=Eumeta variegata TaxID=151549 RepID=A0A4C1WSG2_EUMVA|nr:Anosmin-1 [Eumeta japonica]